MTLNKRWISLGLTLLGMLGVGGTAYAAVKCSKKAENETETKKKLLAYAPAIMIGGASCAAIAGSHYISRKEIAALTATCTYLAANRNKIVEKVKNVLGEEKAKEFEKDIAKEEKAHNNRQTIEETGYGDTLFLDLYLGRKFRSSIGHVEDAIKKLNWAFHSGNYVSMNDFYAYIGIEPSIAGDRFGWPANDDYYDYSLERPIEMDLVKSEDESGELMYAIDIHYGFYPMEYWNEV